MYPKDYRLLTITLMTISEIFFASFPPHKLYFSSHPNALTLLIRHTTDGIRVRQIFFLVKCFLHLIFENSIFHQSPRQCHSWSFFVYAADMKKLFSFFFLTPVLVMFSDQFWLIYSK